MDQQNRRSAGRGAGTPGSVPLRTGGNTTGIEPPTAETSNVRAGTRVDVSGRWFMASALALVLLMSSCGLPVLIFIAPPLVERSPEPPTRYFFAHNPENTGADFQGYDLWYRIYREDDQDVMRGDTDAIEREPVPPGISRLEARRFRRVAAFRPGEELFNPILPAVPLAPSATRGIEFFLDFGANTSQDISPENLEILVRRESTQSNGDEESPVISTLRRRNIDDPPSSERSVFAGFWDRASYLQAGETESDGEGGSGTTQDIHFEVPSPEEQPDFPGDLRVILYAIAVGTDPSSLTRIYSEPRRISDNSDPSAPEGIPIRLQPR